jgi:hypothetical protein
LKNEIRKKHSHIFQLRQTEEKCAQYELTIDRLAREKTSIAADLDMWKERIQRQEVDLSQVNNFELLSYLSSLFRQQILLNFKFKKQCANVIKRIRIQCTFD